MNKLINVILILFGIVILQINCAQVGRYLHVFESYQDSVLVLDRLFFAAERNTKACGDYQIFCDWLYNAFISQNNLENVIIYDLRITKTIEYMFFFKTGKNSQPAGRRMTPESNCGEYGQVCEFLDSYEDYDDHNMYTNQSLSMERDTFIDFDF